MTTTEPHKAGHEREEMLIALLAVLGVDLIVLVALAAFATVGAASTPIAAAASRV